jgi:hypothetical protein
MRRRHFFLLILVFAISAQITPGQEPKPSPTATPESQEPKTFTGIPPGFQTSDNPHSWLLQTWIGRRNNPSTEVENKVANVTELKVEKEVIYSPCTSEANTTCAGDEAKIRITTEAEDKENDVLTYAYTVSAGKIIGQGANVIWDLSGVPARKHTITVGVNDGCGVCGTTMTRTVEVKAIPEIESVSFDKSEVVYWCPFRGMGMPADYCSKEQMFVDVRTNAKNLTDDLTYYYVVTGGKIIGSGPNVRWNLQDTKPGKYSITVGIGKDDVILGKTVTRSIHERVCAVCDPPCECGTLSAEGPKSAKPGDTAVITATVVGGLEVSYKWTVSGGTVLNDPKGSSIMVKIPADFKEAAFNATVELSGTQPGCDCPTVQTVIIPINK